MSMTLLSYSALVPVNSLKQIY